MDDSERPQNAAVVPPSAVPSKQWLSTFITLLGSTGVISVIGPIVGQLYWEGYLQAFGLQPEEFPASSTLIALYAYKAVLNGVAVLWLAFWRAFWWAALALLFIGATTVLTQEVLSRSWTTRLREWFSRTFTERSTAGVSLRATTATLALLAVLTVVAYFVLAALVIAMLPMNARELGLAQGRWEVSQSVADGDNPVRCEHVRSPSLPTGCHRAVAFTEKQIAVLVAGRTLRVPREGTVIDSPVDASAAASSAAAASRASGR